MRTRRVLIPLCMCIAAVLFMTGCGSQVGINSGNSGGINCAGCGSSGGGGTTSGGGVGSTTTGQVALTMIDPPTCASPRFAFSHIYVSVSSVQLNTVAGADQTTGNWVEAAPALATSPKQIDLFNFGTIGNLSNNGVVEVATGTYKTARLILAPNNAIVPANQCGTSANCVVYNAQTIPIDVTAESTTGIFISGAELTGGQVTVGSTATNLNFLFDSCSSLVAPSSTTMRFIPNVTAWAGAINSWNVGLSDLTTGSRIGSSDGLVAFEQADSSGVYRIVSQAATDGSGNATVYVPPGNYVVVADATAPFGGTGEVVFSPVVVTGVTSTLNSNSLSISLPQSGPSTPGTITGTITAQTPGTGPDVRIGVIQKGTFNGGLSQPYTIPLLGDWSATTNVVTQGGGSCGTGETCATFSINVPGQPLYLRTFTDSTAIVSTTTDPYTVDALAYQQSSGGLPNCSSPEQATSSNDLGSPLTVGPGMTVGAAPLNYTGCQ